MPSTNTSVKVTSVTVPVTPMYVSQFQAFAAQFGSSASVRLVPVVVLVMSCVALLSRLD